MELLDLLGAEGLDYERLLVMLFNEYKHKKEIGDIHCLENAVPKRLIEFYYLSISDPNFETVVTNFKKKYIYNESELELVHSKEEMDGLGEAYEYIHKFLKTSNINVYTIAKINSLLFSKTNYPSAGGKFRDMIAYLPTTGIDLADWSEIPPKLNELYLPVNELVQKGIKLGSDKNRKDIINYIDECVELNCKLIKIHPFFDGNGRTIRTFTNLLFKLAKIPPIYVKASEREEYEFAMHEALGEDNYDPIKEFYYCKICDSIAELDMDFREKKTKTK